MEIEFSCRMVLWNIVRASNSSWGNLPHSKQEANSEPSDTIMLFALV